LRDALPILLALLDERCQRVALSQQLTATAIMGRAERVAFGCQTTQPRLDSSRSAALVPSSARALDELGQPVEVSVDGRDEAGERWKRARCGRRPLQCGCESRRFLDVARGIVEHVRQPAELRLS